MLFPTGSLKPVAPVAATRFGRHAHAGRSVMCQMFTGVSCTNRIAIITEAVDEVKQTTLIDTIEDHGEKELCQMRIIPIITR